MMITSKEFYNKVKNNEDVDNVHVNKSGFQVMLGDTSNILKFVFSSNVVDLSGDRVFPEGIDTKMYREKNSLILLHHDMHSFPIGRTIALDVVNNDLIGTVEFFTDLDEADVGTNARAAVELIKRGTMGLSITFIPKKFELNSTDGIDFLESFLIETSVVSVPACPAAYLISEPEVVANSVTEDLVKKNDIVERQRMAAKRQRIIALN